MTLKMSKVNKVLLRNLTLQKISSYKPNLPYYPYELFKYIFVYRK